MNTSKRAVIVSSDIYEESLNTLYRMDIDIIYSYENRNVNSNLKKHVDMQLVKLNDKIYISAPECYDYYCNVLSEFDIILLKGNTLLSSNYPDDIAYNINVGEKYAVHNFKYTDTKLKECLSNHIMIHVSQGYTSCSLCRICDDSYITSDKGIYKALTQFGCNVLKISDGNILLPGFDYGFFGGASFMLSKKELAVNGNIEYHPDSKAIVDFCSENNVTVLSLANKPIMDIGSFVII